MRAIAVAVICAGVASAACDYPRVALHDHTEIVDAPTADAPSDALDDAPSMAIDAGCVAGARRCEGNTVTECQAGTWSAVESCSSLCSLGACIAPPSCGGGVASCGPGANESCCRSLPVIGGMFSRSYDGVSSNATDDRFRATIADFDLDRYEVTTARFQAFVDAYPANRPMIGTGKNPSDASDPGWLDAWTSSLPATKADVMKMLDCAGAAQVAINAVRCVSWYAAHAFCIWDGGRLPTEAEWNYAAAGGDQQRVYPWSSPPSNQTITSAQAVFGASGPERPGTRSPAGDGRWGQADLAGNVWEWVLDYYATPYPSTSCNNCENQTVTSFRGNRGGAYVNASSTLISALRAGSSPDTPDPTIGFRCARNPTP